MLEELTRKYVSKFNDKDLEGVADFFHDDFALEDPVVVRVEGKEACVEEVRKIFDSNPGRFIFKASNVYVSGTSSIIEFVLEVEGATLKGVDIIDWDGEKMRELRAYLDIPK